MQGAEAALLVFCQNWWQEGSSSSTQLLDALRLCFVFGKYFGIIAILPNCYKQGILNL